MGFDNGQLQISFIYLFSVLIIKYVLLVRYVLGIVLWNGCAGEKTRPCLQEAYLLVEETDERRHE